MASIQHKCFLSYHHADQNEVDRFVRVFDEHADAFITRGIGINFSNDIINSNNPEYVMRRIRDLYLKDSTVTIILMGQCTWARKYVDWEIQASLHHGEKTIPNGLLGIKLPSFRNETPFPNRLNINLRSKDEKECYARRIDYPQSIENLTYWIEDAFIARTNRAHLIKNPREKFSYNKYC